MKSPFGGGFGWQELEATPSTQRDAATALKQGEPIAGVIARHQTAGVGRFGRTWISSPGESLTMSLIFRDYADHPQPYLIGMALAVAAAGALHCQLRWPNDLVVGDRKLGGILTEVIDDGAGHAVPVVGIGVNLNQTMFPDEIADRAISLHQAHGGTHVAREIADQIMKRLPGLPEPDDWRLLEPIWALFDRTPGKTYLLPTGEVATAVAIGSAGQLLCSVAGESRTVYAAEAIFGQPAL